jgi:hypothetical protein
MYSILLETFIIKTNPTFHPLLMSSANVGQVGGGGFVNPSGGAGTFGGSKQGYALNIVHVRVLKFLEIPLNKGG